MIATESGCCLRPLGIVTNPFGRVHAILAAIIHAAGLLRNIP
jgi:hypothetical protein